MKTTENQIAKESQTIFKKLLAFQKLNISVKKDGKNPHFKSHYATLNEVLDKVKKPLNELGIVVIFAPETEGLRTILYDSESDTKVEGFMKYVDCGNAQKLLSCNTYFRRGSLVSLLGLEDEDDDGNKASAPIAVAVVKAPKPYLNGNSEAFEKAKEYIQAGHSIDDIRKKYDVSQAVEESLLAK